MGNVTSFLTYDGLQHGRQPTTFGLDGTPQSSFNDTSGASIFTEVTVSTAGANRNLYAVVASLGIVAQIDAMSSTVFGGGLTWSLVRQSVYWERHVSIWKASAPSQLSSATIRGTATCLNTVQTVSFTVFAFTGDTVGVDAATQGDAIAPQTTLVGTTAGSTAIVGAAVFEDAAAPTPTANVTTYVDRVVQFSRGTLTAKLTNSSAGGNITLGASAPATAGVAVVALEIKAA
jgi:hypothetical protein